MPSGILNIDKPAGVSSAAVVNRVKKITGFPCGHMGTLDPLASGVLPVGVGNASRLFDYLLKKEKVYRAVFLFGAESDTLDSTGEISFGAGPVPSEQAILSALPALTGEILQEPPLYSAKSVNGMRAYDLARRGIPFTLEKKKVIIYSLSLTGFKGEGKYEFSVRCGGGTYIRSIARDLAAALGTKAIMVSLVREQSGAFSLAEALSPETLTLENWQSYLVPPEKAVDFPVASFTGIMAKRLADGLSQPFEGKGLYRLWLNGSFYGIAEAGNGTIKTKTKLC